jgi:hypothetical protein
MTHRAVGFGRGFPRVWLLPIGVLTVTLGIAATGRLSRSIAADLVAWWPVWLGLAVAAYVLRERKFGQIRAAGIVPLVALGFVLLFIWGHLAGWSLMPSADPRLVGPVATGFETASLRAAIDGEIVVRGGSEFLYDVEPVRRGGAIGIPGASEQVLDSTIAVVLEPPDDPGIYTFAGWDLMLSEIPVWELDLDGALDADLSTLQVSSMSVAGSGEVVLGPVEVETPVTVEGDFRIVLPQDVPARVVGMASVPSTWSPDANGAVSPALGTGWVITVKPGATVTVAQP